MYCKRCGLKLPQNAAFCPKCGMNLAENGGSLGGSPVHSNSTLRCPVCPSNNLWAQAQRKAFNPFIIIVSMLISVILVPLIAIALSAFIADATLEGAAVWDAIFAAAIVSIPTGIVLGVIVSIVACVRRSKTYDSIFVCQNCGCSSRTE